MKCTLSFPNLTISQLVEVKQLCIKQFYAINFMKSERNSKQPPQPLLWIHL